MVDLRYVLILLRIEKDRSVFYELHYRFKIDMQVKKSCHYFHAFLCFCRENGSGSRTEKGAIRAGNVDLLCIAVSP